MTTRVTTTTTSVRDCMYVCKCWKVDTGRFVFPGCALNLSQLLPRCYDKFVPLEWSCPRWTCRLQLVGYCSLEPPLPPKLSLYWYIDMHAVLYYDCMSYIYSVCSWPWNFISLSFSLSPSLPLSLALSLSYSFSCSNPPCSDAVTCVLILQIFGSWIAQGSVVLKAVCFIRQDWAASELCWST